MKPTCIALLLVALSADSSAQTQNTSLTDTVNYYGVINLTGQISDDGKGSYRDIKSNSSRMGINASSPLSPSFAVVLKAEIQLNISDDDKDNITSRNQYLGIDSKYGQFLLGKNDTVTKQSSGRVDLFNNLSGDMKRLFAGKSRPDETITYKSPNLSGLQAGLTYISEGQGFEDDGVSIAMFYGDKQHKTSDYYAAIGIDNDVNGFDLTRATLTTVLKNWQLGLMLQHQEHLISKEKMDGFVSSIAYSFDNFVLKSQYQTADFDQKGRQYSMHLGLDYQLAANAKLIAFYSEFEMNEQDDQSYFALGMEYKF